MKLRLIAVGTRMPGWVEEAFADYSRRLPPEYGFALSEIAVTPRGKNPDLARLKRDEGEKILKALPREVRLVTLDERGGQWTTEQLALRLQRWQQDGRDVALAIGGPDGHAPEVLARAEESWGLSKLVLPHALVRVLVVEALYRAWSLNANHPYHRA
ncbi:23S rRNA (pseudouridine(1915)-N(3))-methyltransferase RlmH [Stagnimonas aquatica]|uniref:Ribosomal RNA large subunit methyltransferase H n=1 Tax=Stagnimonas aquatica TaxID=2689987 RepID=A0A3N0VKF6_9GAMM|nr:23S rRNA (pseudouridine(1915)-N(3))-methyltransferase RlmH [Stagnimonas aquatica]ROH93249.1 23S rRNA (pseudouridine(1915)-N(3))-methyltransferase RlmH [Stagnimonas aquatica]